MAKHICIAIILSLTLVTSHVRAQGTEPIEATQIFPDVDAIVVFQLKLLEERLDDDVKTGLASTHEKLESLLSLDTSSCHEVIFQFGAPEYLWEDSRHISKTIGVLFRGADGDEMSQEKIDEFTERFQMEKHSYNEQVYFNRHDEPTFRFFDNSFQLCETERLKALVDAEANSLADREVDLLSNVSRDSAICIHIDFSKESFRSFFPLMLEGMRDLDAVESMKVIGANASSLTLTVDLDTETPLQLVVETAEHGNTESLEEATKEFAEAVQGFAAVFQREISVGAPTPEIRETTSEFADALVAWFAEPEITSNDTSVTLTLNGSDPAKLTLNTLVKMLNAVGEMFLR